VQFLALPNHLLESSRWQWIIFRGENEKKCWTTSINYDIYFSGSSIQQLKKKVERLQLSLL
jgi:hypothetical protein